MPKWKVLVCGLTVALAAVTTPITLPANAGELAPTSLKPFLGIFPSGETTTEITRFGSVYVGVTLRSGTIAVSDQTVELWAKPYGSSSFQMLGTATTGGSGVARLTHSPARYTKYLWKYLGSTVYAASPMPSELIVRVHARVSLSLNDMSLRTGQTLVARGVVRPSKPGVTATLWRVAPTGWTRLATGTIRSDGSYRITKTFRTPADRGLVVTVPASTGNLKGVSPARTVRGSDRGRPRARRRSAARSRHARARRRAPR